MKQFRSFLKNNGLFLIVIALLVCFNLRCDVAYIKTGSMKPVLQIGAFCVIDNGQKTLKTGDIAAYRTTSNQLVIHRVKSESEEGYTFQGDDNAIPDAGTVSRDSIKGKVVFHTNLFSGIIRKAANLSDS